MLRTLRLLQGSFSIHRLPPDAKIPPDVYGQRFYSLTRTDDEVSILCEDGIQVPARESSPGWCGLRFEGTLDFSELGILAGISHVLAEARISIFAISTYETDYIFFKCEHLDDTVQVLAESGYRVIR